MNHKLLQVMKERGDSKPLSGNIQIDDVYSGGERHGGKRGRGSSGKTPFVAAVKTNGKGDPVAMRMTRLDDFKKESILNWAQQHVTAGSYHEAIVTGGGPECVLIEAFT
jgi:hypothetical protein